MRASRTILLMVAYSLALPLNGQDYRPITEANSRPALSGRYELPFELNHDFLVIVKGSIGRVSGLRMLVDTGSPQTAIDETLAKQLGLKTHWARGKHLLDSRALKVKEARVPDLLVGRAHIGELALSAANRKRLNVGRVG
jgi:hypothetical protein